MACLAVGGLIAGDHYLVVASLSTAAIAVVGAFAINLMSDVYHKERILWPAFAIMAVFAALPFII